MHCDIGIDDSSVHRREEEKEMKRAQLIISNEQDRLTVAAVLVKNGYSVRTVKVKATATGKLTKTAVEYWREEQ